MRYLWQESDIQLGREIIFNRNERLIIGYVVGGVAQLVEDLNSGNYEPRYVTVQERTRGP